MFVKSVNINFDRNKKLWYVIIGAIGVAIVLITSAFILVDKEADTIKNKKILKADIFNITSYDAKFIAKIESNKNINRYEMKEHYEKNTNNEIFKFEIINEEKEKIEYIISDGILKINSTTQNNNMEIKNYETIKSNLLSLTTFFEIYNDFKENSRENILNEELEDKVCYTIFLSKLKEEDILYKKYIDIIKESIGVSKIELILDKANMLPIEYNVYNNENKAYIEITYNLFK